MLVFVADLIDQVEAGHVGQHQIEHHAIEPLVPQRVQGRVRVSRIGQMRGLISDQLPNAVALTFIVLNDQQLFRGGFPHFVHLGEDLS